MPPKDVSLPDQPTEATQDQKILQIPQRVFTPTPLSEFSRKYSPTLNEDRERDAERFNRMIEPINEELRVNGLTPKLAIRLVLSSIELDLGVSELAHQAAQVAADYFGLPNLDYGLAGDINAAESFAKFLIDPREVVREYQDFSWEEAVSGRLKLGEVAPTKPRFAEFAKIILYSAMFQKSLELANTAKVIESTIPPEAFTFGPGYRGGGGLSAENQAKYNESRNYAVAADAIQRAALARLNPPELGATTSRPSELRNLSDSVWYGLITGKVRELASTQALIQNSQFVEDVIAKSQPVASSPGMRPRLPNIDLATIITPKAPPK